VRRVDHPGSASTRMVSAATTCSATKPSTVSSEVGDKAQACRSAAVLSSRPAPSCRLQRADIGNTG
jgi:hypothetical protein